MSARAESPVGEERVWLLRAILVLVSPRAVFALLRDDSDSAARSRSEAVLALVLLAGIASVLWTPTYGRLMDDVVIDGLLVAVIAFIGGGIYGFAVYFAGGLLLYWLTRAVGGITYRQARHVLAFAAAPLALSLFLVWPVRLAVYGEDVFRSGGSDRGPGNTAFIAVELAFAVWALGLLVVGIRALRRR
ncbi:MAG: YIP1 family protein [Gaiellaceae bacterium]